jgi:serine-type D-Ala-D-Ala carboxypeptidase (penicillin-binding protein 5/6)
MTKNIQYFITALFLSFFIFVGINSFQNNLQPHLTAQISEPFENNASLPPAKKPLTPAPEIKATAVASVEILADGRQEILLDKNINKPLPIASLTKLMTALVVSEDPETFDFSKIITISQAAADQGNTPHFGNLKAGEKYTLEKLMELMLVYSSNDAAYSLSEIIGTDNFVAKMNKKALDLGMDYTYFINPTGLDPKGVYKPETNEMNYSTAQDLIKLTSYILKNQPSIFKFSQDNYNLPIENGVSNIALNENQNFIGGKTGFTQNAKGSILFIFQDAQKNTFINIILGSDSEESRIQEMQKLINWLSF